MNFIVFIFMTAIVAVFGMAAFLIYAGVDGWGWFLFCAVVILGSFSVKEKRG